MQGLINAKRDSGKVGTSVLDHLMTTEEGDERATDEELVDFIITFAVAGSETSCATMQSMLCLLHENRELAQELRAEVAESWDGKESMTRALLQKLHKCKAFVAETLRLFPPFSMVSRMVCKSTQVPTGSYNVAAGTTLLLGSKSVTDLHSCASEEVDLRHWLDDTNNFSDSQWTDIKRMSAFGNGSRMCIGYKFAVDEILVFLSIVLHDYNFVMSKRKHVKFFFNHLDVWGDFSIRDEDEAVQ